jgi:hypothetical protein
VRHLIDTSHTRDVVAFVVFDGSRERRDLRARLEELAERMIWEDILHETHEPAVQTWRHLARVAAASEDLLAST